jgi:1,4-alpha-glucan branching enzyme
MRTAKKTQKAAGVITVRPPQPAPVKREAKKSEARTKTPAPAPNPFSTIRLELYAPGAQRVFVAGSFNNWEPSATALYASAAGHWSRELALAPGQYEYLFLVDGQWRPDPNAKDYNPNPFGGLNCVLEIPRR